MDRTRLKRKASAPAAAPDADRTAAIEAARLHLIASHEVMAACLADEAFLSTTAAIALKLVDCLKSGGKIMIAGNGGSAGDAQHMAGEFLSRFRMERTPLAAIALTVDSSVMTAIGNDYGFEHVFARQVMGLGRPGDVLIALSTSGRSPNILSAMDAARAMDVCVIAMTGADGNAMASRADVCLHAPSADTPLIQQVHIAAAHIICGIVERMCAGSAGAGRG